MVLDDEQKIADKISKYLTRNSFNAFPAYNIEQARNIVSENIIDLAIIDVILPGANGLDFVEFLKEKSPQIEIIMISGFGTMDMVISAMHKGAVDFVTKPFSLDNIYSAIKRTNKYFRLQKSEKNKDYQNSLISKFIEDKIGNVFIGKSKEMVQVVELAQKIGEDRDANVLITGENGTGKEIIAKIIHYSSDRYNHAISTVNCSAVPESLLESEFFGHRKGAFTDAKETKRGYFEQANGGSLFLDEIADMPISLQAKLLRALEEKKIKLIGSEKEISVDVRIISATNRNIKHEIKENNFRLDLFHRINTFVIKIPPLRERPEDIECLLNHFLHHFAHKKNKAIPKLNKRSINILKKYHFPGNVRELRNMVERAVILSSDRPLDISDLFLDPTTLYQENKNEDLNMVQHEIELILRALTVTDYNQNQAANLLGISRDALIRRMKKHDILIQKNLDV